MNLAEKAKRAREQQEKQKQERKERFIANIVLWMVVAIMGAVVVITLGIVVTAETKNIEALAGWHKAGIGALIACVVGGVISFFGGKERAVSLTSVLTCTVLFLALVLFGMSGMLKG